MKCHLLCRANNFREWVGALDRLSHTIQNSFQRARQTVTNHEISLFPLSRLLRDVDDGIDNNLSFFHVSPWRFRRDNYKRRNPIF